VENIFLHPILTIKMAVDFTSNNEGVRRCFSRSLFILLRERSKGFFQQKPCMTGIGGDSARPKIFPLSTEVEGLKGPRV
jgi:hypothetical protein